MARTPQMQFYKTLSSFFPFFFLEEDNSVLYFTVLLTECILEVCHC